MNPYIKTHQSKQAKQAVKSFMQSCYFIILRAHDVTNSMLVDGSLALPSPAGLPTSLLAVD